MQAIFLSFVEGSVFNDTAGHNEAWVSAMFRRFLANRDGNFAVVVAIGSLPLLAGLAGAIDLANTLAEANQLQNSLDASALAIGGQYYSGMSDDELQRLGEQFFAANMESSSAPADDNFEYQNATAELLTSASIVDGSAIIKVSSNISTRSLFGSNVNWGAHRQAYVRVFPGMPACVLALNPSAADAVKIDGSTSVYLASCVIAANSNANDAVSRSGSALISAECVTTVGRTEGFATINAKLACGSPLEKQWSSLDPLMGVTAPSPTPCMSMSGGKTKALNPGTYCNKTLSGDITLNPGTYILRGGEIKLGGNGSLFGHGVTIFLIEGAQISINANETIDLSPPTSGAYAGITIYQKSDNAQDVTINGTSASKLSGFVYAPAAHILFAGTSDLSGSGDCVRIIGDTVEMTGNAKIASDCSAQLGERPMYASRRIVLVQ